MARAATGALWSSCVLRKEQEFGSGIELPVPALTRRAEHKVDLSWPLRVFGSRGVGQTRGCQHQQHTGVDKRETGDLLEERASGCTQHRLRGGRGPPRGEPGLPQSHDDRSRPAPAALSPSTAGRSPVLSAQGAKPGNGHTAQRPQGAPRPGRCPQGSSPPMDSQVREGP